MRYDAEHKERTRRRVLQEAAAAIRRDGPDRVGVADLMAKAGLTHGGFYAHFKSKDDLIAAAIARSFDDSHARLLAQTDGRDPAMGLADFVDGYLSVLHRDRPEQGCPVPALAGDAARLAPAARAQFGAGVARMTGHIAGLLQAAGRVASPDAAGALAASAVAEMAGALALSRVVAEPAQSEALLRASRQAIRRRLGLPDRTGEPPPPASAPGT